MEDSLQYPSHYFLQDRVTGLFDEHRSRKPAFPGSCCDLMWPSEKVVDVVLFGDGPYALMNAALWPPEKRYRLWVLNDSFRDALCRLFPLTRKQIGVIPRGMLVSDKKKKLPLPRNSFSFVSSSRASSGKNLPVLGKVISFLQEKDQFQDSKYLVFGTGKTEDYKRQIQTPGVSIKGDHGLNWMRNVKGPAVYVSLALETTDDFSVSCAQAEEAGWPLIVPDWGPYRELSRGHAILVPPEMILRARNNLSASRDIADFIAEKWNESEVTGGSVRRSLKDPEILTAGKLKEVVAQCRYRMMVKEFAGGEPLRSSRSSLYRLLAGTM